MSTIVTPLTTTTSIANELLTLEVGDEVTVQTEQGYKINRKITDVDENAGDINRTEIMVGDVDGPHILVYVDDLVESLSPSSRFNVYGLSLTDDPDNPAHDRGAVRKLWVWQ